MHPTESEPTRAHSAGTTRQRVNQLAYVPLALPAREWTHSLMCHWHYPPESEPTRVCAAGTTRQRVNPHSGSAAGTTRQRVNPLAYVPLALPVREWTHSSTCRCTTRQRVNPLERVNPSESEHSLTGVNPPVREWTRPGANPRTCSPYLCVLS